MKSAADHPNVPELDYRPPRPLLRWIAVLIAFVGWWLSLDLAKLSFGGAAVTPWLQQECGGTVEIDGDFDCRSVLHSRWGSIPISKDPNASRLPTAVLGMGYFAFVGLWFLFVGSPTRSRWARHLLIMAVVFIGALFSAEMIRVMQEELHKWCRGCLAVHAANGLLFLLTILAFPWRRDPANRAPHPRGRLALATLCACTLLFLLHLSITQMWISNHNSLDLLKKYQAITNDPEYVRWDYQRQPIEPLLSGLPIEEGPADAPNRVVIFSDAQCTACKAAYETLATVIDKYPGKLAVTYLHYPMDSACNPAFPDGGHLAACCAARAIEAARIVGGPASALMMRDMCYDRVEELETANFAAWAGELNLDRAKFDAALDAPETAQRIQEDIALGQKLDIHALPILYLNGRRLQHWRTPETWADLLIGVETAPTSAPASDPTDDDAPEQQNEPAETPTQAP